MKPGMINAPRSKSGKKGRYNTIPFQHKTNSKPTTLAQSILQQGLKAIIKENNLSKPKLGPNGSPVEGKVATIRTGQAYNQLSDNTRRTLGSHANLLDGLTKYQKNYAKKTESSYFTFRRVSKNSPSKAWIHPGFEGVFIFTTLEQYIRQEVKSMMEDLLR